MPALPGASTHVPAAAAAAAHDPRLLLRDHRRWPWPLATSDGSLSAIGSRRRICMYPSSQQRHLCVRAYPQPRQTQRRRSSDIAGSASHRACQPRGERKVEFSCSNGYGERSEPWPKLAFEQVLTSRRTTARNDAAAAGGLLPSLSDLLRLSYAVSDRVPTEFGLAAPHPHAAPSSPSLPPCPTQIRMYAMPPYAHAGVVPLQVRLGFSSLRVRRSAARTHTPRAASSSVCGSLPPRPTQRRQIPSAQPHFPWQQV